MIKGPGGGFFNVPHVYVGNLFHIVYRSEDDDELVAAVRTPIDGIDWVIIDNLMKEAQDDGVIRECSMRPDFSIDYWAGWETILAFDLVPCLELYIEMGKNGNKTCGYRVITNE